MIASALIELLLRSALLLGITWLSAEAVRRSGASAAMRHMIWIFGFAALALLPLLAAILPELPVPVLPAEPAVMAAVATDGPVGPQPLQNAGPSAGGVLQLIYFGVALGLLARLVAGRLILARMWMQARDLADPKRLQLLDELGSAFGPKANVSVRISRRATVPMTWGTIRPRILLPATAAGWSDEQWRVVLLHELGHVARRDSAGRTASAIICTFYWANPIAWMAAERMRREQEHACDDLVLSHGAEAAVYARNLLLAARSAHSCGPRFAAAMISRSDLESRLLAIVGDVSRRRAGRTFVAASGLSCLAALTVAAAVTPVTATTPVQVQDVPVGGTQIEAPAGVPASAPAPVAVIATPAIVPHSAKRPAAETPAPLPTLAGLEAGQAAEQSAVAAAYDRAVATYREQKAQYLTDLDAYRVKVAAYRAAMDQYKRDLARHRQLVEAVRTLPEGDPNKVVPPAPTAPVAPVVPVPPVVPTVPPNLHQS